MNEANKTLLGNYHVVALPDGSLFAFTKLENGKWVPTEERVKEKTEDTQAEFERRFADTTTVPADYIKKNTQTLVPDGRKMQESRNRLDAYLGEILGNPDDILSGKIKVKEIKEVGIKRHVEGLIKVLDAPKWNKVREMIWK